MSGLAATSIGHLEPQRADETDGVAIAATTRLDPVKYPNRLDDVAIIGKPSDWSRSFLLRPTYAGRFVLLFYPEKNISRDTVIMKTVNFPSFNSKPKILEIKIPKPLREYRHWAWRLIKTTYYQDEESDYELIDSIADPGSGYLTGRSAAYMADKAIDASSFSYLLYEASPAMLGQVEFLEENERAQCRTVVWSCHQPFDSSGGKAIVHKDSEKLMQWYRSLVEEFQPHRVWGLGDTSYSDGTGTLNFVKQVYDKPGWQNNFDLRKDLLSLYRLNYRYHWCFENMQRIMRQYPHIAMWDDHEIRDGYGSDENDFKPENKAILEIASQAAQEYLFSWNTPLRSESSKNYSSDNHLAYIDSPSAHYIFDGRNSRRYGEDLPIPPDIPLLAASIVGFLAGGGIGGGLLGLLGGAIAGSATTLATAAVEKQLIDLYRWNNPGEVISDQQLHDFGRFCQHIKGQASVRYLILGNSVPFIYVNDFIETLASELELATSDIAHGVRDDIRDSWHSPGNRRQLSRVHEILLDLHLARPDIEIVNLSGDIHISNCFVYQPEGFTKPLFQVTSSALTNRISISEDVSNLLSTSGPLGFLESNEDFGDIHRLWHEGVSRNFLSIDMDDYRAVFHLHVYNVEKDSGELGKKDIKLIIRPNGGYQVVAN